MEILRTRESAWDFEHYGSKRSSYIGHRYLVVDKTWVKPTLLNLLNRLVARGFVSCEKNGKLNHYTALVKKEDYLQKESKNFLKQMHHNSISSLLASLYGGKKLSKKDIDELSKFIEEAK